MLERRHAHKGTPTTSCAKTAVVERTAAVRPVSEKPCVAVARTGGRVEPWRTMPPLWPANRRHGVRLWPLRAGAVARPRVVGARLARARGDDRPAGAHRRTARAQGRGAAGDWAVVRVDDLL